MIAKQQLPYQNKRNQLQKCGSLAFNQKQSSKNLSASKDIKRNLNFEATLNFEANKCHDFLNFEDLKSIQNKEAQSGNDCEKYQGCMISEDGNQKIKKAYTNKKYYLKKTCKYSFSPFEEAKIFLKNNNYSLESLKKEKFYQHLNKDDMDRLIRAVKKHHAYIKSKSQNTKNSSIELKNDQQTTMQNVQIFRNEVILQELSSQDSFEGKVAKLHQQNKHNHFQVLDLINSLQQPPFENFLQLVCEFIQQLVDSQQQTRLMVSFCGLYDGQIINLKHDLTAEILNYSTNIKLITQQQALGFMKLMFVTNGNIHNSTLVDLKEFDSRYQQCFQAFKQWLNVTVNIPYDICMIIPNSCFMFGLPFCQQLKNNSHILTRNIPFQFLETFINIFVFSLEKSTLSFESFISTAQQGFLIYLEKIETCQVLNLFNHLLKEIQSFNNIWFQNLRNCEKLLSQVFEMLQDNKIKIFDNELCQTLVQNNLNLNSNQITSPQAEQQESDPQQNEMLQNCSQQNIQFSGMLPQINSDQRESLLCINSYKQIDNLLTLAQQFKCLAPQLCILNCDVAQSFIKSSFNLPLVNLIGFDSPQVNITLQQLLCKRRNDGFFGVYLIDEEQGVNLDINTSIDFSNCSEIVLILGVRSAMRFEQLQIRIGQYFNKSSKFFVKLDSQLRSLSSDDIQYQINLLQNHQIDETKDNLDLNQVSVIDEFTMELKQTEQQAASKIQNFDCQLFDYKEAQNEVEFENHADGDEQNEQDNQKSNESITVTTDEQLSMQDCNEDQKEIDTTENGKKKTTLHEEPIQKQNNDEQQLQSHLQQIPHRNVQQEEFQQVISKRKNPENNHTAEIKKATNLTQTNKIHLRKRDFKKSLLTTSKESANQSFKMKRQKISNIQFINTPIGFSENVEIEYRKSKEDPHIR